MDPHTTINFRLGIAFLLALFAGLPTPAQRPTIKLTVTPGALFLGHDLTFTITVESAVKLQAGVLDTIPLRTIFVSMQHSGPNIPADKCSEKTGYNPATSFSPMVVPYGTSIQCPILFPGTETITIVVSTIEPGVVTNTAALVWETNAHPPQMAFGVLRAVVGCACVLQVPVRFWPALFLATLPSSSQKPLVPIPTYYTRWQIRECPLVLYLFRDSHWKSECQCNLCGQLCPDFTPGEVRYQKYKESPTRTNT